MIWMYYNRESIGQVIEFKVQGDLEGDVMGKQRNGTPKDYWLYKPGDVFVVNENGWLVKQEEE